MPLLRDTLVMAVGGLGAVVASQAPEFAQQYRQRLGGALVELNRFVEDFDTDASRSGLTREQALDRHLTASERLFHDRGTSMQRTIARQEALTAQADLFERLPPAVRPLALARNYDRDLMDGAWRDFEPGVPLTLHGALWTAGGFFVGAVLTFLLARLFRFRKPAGRVAARR